MGERASTTLPARRLLTRAQAADYCGLSLIAFDREAAGVRTIEFGGAYGRRWDRHDLDTWIDRRKGSPEAPSFDELLAGLDGHGDGRAG